MVELLDSIRSCFAWIVGEASGSSYHLSRWIFLRGLGVLYLIAFLSYAVQLRGLIGRDGILPAKDFLESQRFGLSRFKRFRYFPTLFWYHCSDRALLGVCLSGVVGSAFLISGLLGRWEWLLLAGLWATYLSLTVVGQEFFAFQWDVLLLEVGFVSIFYISASPLILFLLWWILFRLVFESGVVKLSCGDRTWRNLTALNYHFYTQPLSTFIGWFFHQLPSWFQKFSTVMVYVLEIGIPFLMFGNWELRWIAFGGILFLQILIFATGNYNFFNLLTILLAFLLLDDRVWSFFLPADGTYGTYMSYGVPQSLLEMTLAAVILIVSTPQMIRSVFPAFRGPRWIHRLESYLMPFRSINSYGLFRHMTTSRYEITVEGSDDGKEWKAYRFKWKPQELKRRPGFVEPHQPRLDWQMWFAALSPFRTNPWFEMFLARLLEGSPPVLRLLAENPFPNRPPKYVRAMLDEYHFTSIREKRKTRDWWRNRPIGAYSPTLALHQTL